MKKFILALLCLPSLAYADSITTGNLGLLKPSTGVYNTRSWGDKLNADLDIIDSSFTGINSKIINGPISIYDNNGNFLGNATTIRFNPSLTPTMSGSTATVGATGGGGAGSLAVGKGSLVDFTQVSSPTSHVSFATGPFIVTLISPTSAFITLDFSSITAQGKISGASPITETDWTVMNTTHSQRIQQISLDTGTLRTLFGNFTSTSDARGNTFVNFRSTTDSSITNYITINATNTNLLSSTNIWTGGQTWTSFSTYTAPVYISSSILILSTVNYTIPLSVGPGGAAPGSTNVTAIFQDNRNANGISRIAVKNSQDGTEMILGASLRQGHIGTFSNHPISMRTNDNVKIYISTFGLIYFGGSGPGSYIFSDESVPDSSPKTMFDILNGSMTIRGKNAALFIGDNDINGANLTVSSGPIPNRAHQHN